MANADFYLLANTVCQAMSGFNEDVIVKHNEMQRRVFDFAAKYAKSMSQEMLTEFMKVLQ